MPETTGHSLESITEQFKGHTVAQVLRDNALMRAGRGLASSVRRMMGRSPTTSLHSSGSDEQVSDTARGGEGMELRDLSGLAAR
jgi:hypothetical protein